jgi:hypothetical protein
MHILQMLDATHVLNTATSKSTQEREEEEGASHNAEPALSLASFAPHTAVPETDIQYGSGDTCSIVDTHPQPT